MQENKQLKQLVDGKWEDAEELQFFYPQWIEKIPIKFVREIAVQAWRMAGMEDRRMEG